VDHFSLVSDKSHVKDHFASYTLPLSPAGSILLVSSGSGSLSLSPSPSPSPSLSLSPSHTMSDRESVSFPIEKGAAFYVSRDVVVTVHTDDTNDDIHIFQASRGKAQ
jgi:hypothetical protein